MQSKSLTAVVQNAPSHAITIEDNIVVDGDKLNDIRFHQKNPMIAWCDRSR